MGHGHVPGGVGPRGPVGPVEQRLLWFTTVRGLVFGAYGEASADVHDLISTCADQMAQRQWQLAGARNATEMRAFLIGSLRRRMGLAAVQAMARHRLARVPYIGVERQVIVARAQRGRLRRGQPVPWAPEPDHADFFGFQEHARMRGAGA